MSLRMRRVGLWLGGLHTSFGRRILEGVVRYCERDGEAGRSQWQLLSGDWGDVGLGDLEKGGVDGAILSITERSVLDVVERSGLPCVNVAENRLGLKLPSVINDSRRIGTMAARHLMERQIRSLGLFSRIGDLASDEIAESFTAHADGRPVERHQGRLIWADRRDQESATLSQWLRGLPKPAGVFAVSDILARRTLQACRQLDFRVPDEVAVLGLGDYAMVNRLALPPLSSVIQSSYEIGYQAAGLLDRWLGGEQPPATPLLIAPAGVVARRSTDLVAVGDVTVARAVAYIRENLGAGLKVGDIASHVSVSRRWLERKFLENLHRSPAAEIRRAQLERACRLLSDTDWSLSVVAQECGMKAPERLSVLFKRETGLTPGRYRACVRGSDGR